ncbi:ABC transporter ATP-binding protein [Planococcus sp. SE5232]|uniref:ABC transporter ATP-binding protein n=1 Tax=unclassified Planococcus (in: firmicutes) TaxID=2662419 RepID=UPI003D6A67BA
MNPVIQLSQLSKRYKNFSAVEDVSLEIGKGEIYGFIGLNGSGKTTTIKMLLGMVRPSHGSCYIQGRKIELSNHSMWANVGSLVETPYAYPELTVKENLEIFRRLRGVSDADVVHQVMDQLKLTGYAGKKAGKLSLGNTQRLGIAKALLHKPEILILDEPSNGLDPTGIIEVRELFQHLAKDLGVTIFMSSHLLSEVAKIATRIGVIHQGKLLQEIRTDQFKDLLQKRLVIDAREKDRAMTALNHAGYSAVFSKEGRIEITADYAVRHPDEISRYLVSGGIPPTHLALEEEDLESYFLHVITQRKE